MNTTDTQKPADPAAAPPDAFDNNEEVRKVYAKDLREKDRLRTVFKVTRKTKVTARSGKAFLTVGLGDRTGEVDARVFDNVESTEGSFVEGDYVLVGGHVIVFHGKPQFVIEKLERLDPEPIDAKEFAVPAAPPRPTPRAEEASGAASTSGSTDKQERGEKASGEDAGHKAVAQIHELVDRVQDAHVKQLLQAFLADPDVARGLPLAPAAKGIHHAWRGGLAEHILSVMKLAHRIADHYPMADRDLLTAGALLHDIGKVSELSYDKGNGNFDYTDEGRLVGHLVMTAQQIHAKARAIPGFPALLEQHITHLVLAHHGELEYGSPKVPMTLEAYLVHAIDTLDSRVASWLDLMGRDSGNENWTETAKLYDRHLWKGPAPTARGKSPVDGRPRRGGGGGGRNKRRGQGGGGAQAVAKPAEPRAPKEQSGGPKLAFKSFDQLTGPAAPAGSSSADASGAGSGSSNNGEGGASA